GFAEADPTDDVEGIDAARKVVITSYLSFNQVINLADVDRHGISDVELSDIKVADELGYKIKLIGKGTYENSQVQASVAPTLVNKSHQLASVEDEFNAIYVIGDAVGETMFYGKGAGSLATGSAVVSDLLNVTLNFETNLHTLPPHFELKTAETKEMMDDEDTISFKDKESYYLVVQTDGEEINKVETQIKSILPFHKSLSVSERDAHTVGIVIVGIDEAPETSITESGYIVKKIYPVEGV
ncbi:MAG: homoserine dehydrogenase, partial [Staphylococcus equorum]|nr:homoserine dehydrogenase [Staphylococcus equorum]